MTRISSQWSYWFNLFFPVGLLILPYYWRNAPHEHSLLLTDMCCGMKTVPHTLPRTGPHCLYSHTKHPPQRSPLHSGLQLGPGNRRNLTPEGGGSKLPDKLLSQTGEHTPPARGKPPSHAPNLVWHGNITARESAYTLDHHSPHASHRRPLGYLQVSGLDSASIWDDWDYYQVDNPHHFFITRSDGHVRQCLLVMLSHIGSLQMALCMCLLSFS